MTNRMQQLVQNRLMKDFASSMDDALGDDPTVYVIRKVTSQIGFIHLNNKTDSRLSERWSERMAGAVMHTIASTNTMDDNLMRFDDQADYLSHFIVDLIQGHAWNHWYYGAFNYVKDTSHGSAVERLLLDNREYISRVLVRLADKEQLPLLFQVLDPITITSVWNILRGINQTSVVTLYPEQQNAKHTSSPAGTGKDEIFNDIDDKIKKQEFTSELSAKSRALFTLTCRLAEDLKICNNITAKQNKLFDNYQPIGVMDWKDSASLTRSVIDILHYLVDLGYINQANRLLTPGYLEHIDDILKQYDWLDGAKIRNTLMEFASAGTITLNYTGVGKTTPKQKQLLEHLRIVLDARPELSLPANSDSVSFALKTYAALIQQFPQWSDEKLATRVIDALAEVGYGILRSPSLFSLVQSSVATQDNSGLNGLPVSLRNNIELLQSFGDAAIGLLEPLKYDSDTLPVKSRILTTHCAGVFLLLRALADIKLPQLAKKLAYPSSDNAVMPGAFVIPLFMSLAGWNGANDEQLDDGLRIFSSETASMDLEQIEEIWQSVTISEHQTFQQNLLTIMAGQRLISGNALHIYKVNLQSTEVMVAGDPDSHIWVFAQCLDKTLDTGQLIEHWQETWQQVFGKKPDTLVFDETVVPSAAPQFEMDKELQQIHQQGQDNLSVALEKLYQPKLGMETGLAIALCANSVLRVWARWLPRFAEARTPYLLDNFIRRAGQLRVNKDSLEVFLESAPLDVVIEMAGYTNELENLEWMGIKHVAFGMGDIA